MLELKPYSEYVNSKNGNLESFPSHWKLLRIKNTSYLNPTKSEIEKNHDLDVSFIPMENILSAGVVDLSIRKPLSDVYSGYTYFRNGDIIMAKVTPCFENGNIVLLEGLCNGIGFGTTELHVIRVKKDFYTKFFFYFFQSERFRQEGISSMYGVAGLKRIPSEFIQNFIIAVPSYEEQKQIANFLDTITSEIDSLIAYKEKLIKLLEEKRQAIISETVRKGLNPNVKLKDSGVEWIGNIPEHWEIKRMKQIAEVEISNVDKKSNDGEEPVSLCNYVDVYYNDEISDRVDFMQATAKPEQIRKFTLKKNDVIITKDSESPYDIAIPTWVGMDLKEVLCGYHLALLRPNNFVDGKYLFYSLESINIREQYYSLANGVTRFGLSKGNIKNGLFVCPPIDEQIAIGEYLKEKSNEIYTIVSEIRVQIEKLKEYRKSLIYEAVTGKIDVRDYKKVLS
jgi:type I restriction enzyme, S subunit